MNKTLSFLALTLVLTSSAFADEGSDGITVRPHPRPQRSAATVSAISTSKPAEMRVTGQVARQLAKMLGTEASDAGLLLTVNTHGSVALAGQGLLPDSGELVQLRGRAFIQAVDTIDDDSLVVTGDAARLLFNYLQTGRRLSTRITDEGSRLVGESMSCFRSEGRHTCVVVVDSIQ